MTCLDDILGTHNVGVDGIDLIPIKDRLGQAKLDPYDAPFNISLAVIRAAVERAVAHVNTWRMLGEEAGRFRPPLEKFAETLACSTYADSSTPLLNRAP